MKPHPEEVDAVKWVTLEEMDEMMADEGAFSRDGPMHCLGPFKCTVRILGSMACTKYSTTRRRHLGKRAIPTFSFTSKISKEVLRVLYHY